MDKKERIKFIYNVRKHYKIYDKEVLEKIIEQSKIKIELIGKELEMRKNCKANGKCDRDTSAEYE